MKCIKCKVPLQGKQTKFCSTRCSRRFLKNSWQKRRRIIVNKANRELRKRKKGTNFNVDKETPRSIKLKARSCISVAIRDNKIHKLPCEVCKELKVQAHHTDYSKPLEVIWLCLEHHQEVHRKI